MGRSGKDCPRGGRNRRARHGVVQRDGRGGEDPRAPTTAATGRGHRDGTGPTAPGAPDDSVLPYASPARSRASVPARSDASRSSRAKPAGASVRVVTPAAA
ncbi:hypothetical protein GCM10012285_48960 [Streptomyces kronopolitis]|uniref:Uncharacterized protein n=1 Tax=Streptomyces kronopolitis TaxID=1612435 RepID=A0ABQ2JSN9_9ACTN|nr:hypothetical protein GCM10012285_48960 [Streptomyces kronopolitis]